MHFSLYKEMLRNIRGFRHYTARTWPFCPPTSIILVIWPQANTSSVYTVSLSDVSCL